MDFRRHWDNWGWLIPAFIIILVFLRVVLGREAFCTSAGDEHCLREWLSATGNWGAVLIGVPSILFLAKQVRLADESFRQLRKKSDWTTANLTARTVRVSTQVRDGCHGMEKIWAKGIVLPPKDQAEIFLNFLESIEPFIQDKSIDRFEQEIVSSVESDITLERRRWLFQVQMMKDVISGKLALSASELHERGKNYLIALRLYAIEIVALASKAA